MLAMMMYWTGLGCDCTELWTRFMVRFLFEIHQFCRYKFCFFKKRERKVSFPFFLPAFQSYFEENTAQFSIIQYTQHLFCVLYETGACLLAQSPQPNLSTIHPFSGTKSGSNSSLPCHWDSQSPIGNSTGCPCHNIGDVGSILLYVCTVQYCSLLASTFTSTFTVLYHSRIYCIVEYHTVY